MLSFEGASGSAEATNQNNVWESATGQPINVPAVRTTAPGVLQNSGLQPPPVSNALLVRSSTVTFRATPYLPFQPSPVKQFDFLK
jgi:hypothetical protein